MRKVSTSYFSPGLIALTIVVLFVGQLLSPSASAQKKLKKVTGGRRDLQAATANPLVNNPATDQNPGKTQSNAAIISGPGMTLLSTYNDSGSLLSGNRYTGYSRSTDMGATWVDLGSLPFDNAGFPVLASHKASGRIYLSALRFISPGVIVSSSTDQGVTWGTGTQVSRPSGTTDRPWIAVDNFAGSGNGNLYLSFSNSASGDGIRFTRSTDLGATFSAPALIADQNLFNVNGACVAVAPDHSVYVFWLDQSAGVGTPNIIKQRKTTDQGATFSTPTNIATLNTTETNGSLGNVGGFGTNSFPQAALNPVSGDIYVVYNDVNTSAMDSGDIYFQQSTDSGFTWSARLKVNTDATNNLNWQPTIAVTEDGSKVMIAWYDRRNDPNDSLIEYFGRAGSISASTITFGPDFKISDASFPAVFGEDSLVDPTYMGAYDQMSADNSSFYTVWGDNRLSSAPDVRFAKICTELSECPESIVVPNDQGLCGAVVSYSSPGCGIIVLACNPPSGTLFPVGTTTVTCSTTAPSCSFTVTVNDAQAPTISCPANVTAVAPQTCPISTGATVNFAAPMVSDNCPGVTSVCNPPSGSIFPVGTTTVTCTATDASGNTATCSFSVTAFSGCLQDDSNPANVVLFNAVTGEYQFCCGGTVFTGVGTALVKGCIVTIQHYPADRRVLIKFDGARSTGTASLQSPPGVIRCTITDRNTKNNTCACTVTTEES